MSDEKGKATSNERRATNAVIPADAGIQKNEKTLDSGFRRNDEIGIPRPPCTKFLSVRFGNVLGSSGSVIPLFQQQIARGGPVTVTHPEITRYFMSIPEAAQLILQAGAMGEGREIFILKMGEPVRIADLAREVIKFHGLEPYKDIDIEFTGLRPGEKLFEEILTAEEGTDAGRHEKVFIARNSATYSLSDLHAILEEFSSVIADPSPAGNDAVKILLRKYVKHYEAPTPD